MSSRLSGREEFRRFTRYGIVGLTTNLFLYGVFLALYYLGLPPLVAAAICYVLGVALSYVLNRRWTFQSQGRHRHDLPRFVAAYGLGLLASVTTLAILLRWLPAEIAQIINIGLTAVFIYLSLRILRFGKARV